MAAGVQLPPDGTGKIVRTYEAGVAAGTHVQAITIVKTDATPYDALSDAQLRASAVPTSVAAGSLGDVGQAADAEASGNGTVIALLKRLRTLLAGGLPAALVSGRLDVSIGASPATVPVSGPLTDAQLRASAVPVTANAGTNLNTSALALDATLTGGTAKAINRGGAKGTTVAADITGTAEGADHQALDVQLYHGGTAKDPTAIRALTAADVVTVTPPTLTKGTQGATGFSVQSLVDAGRTAVTLLAEAVAGAAAEALITLTQSKQFAATTTGTGYTVTAGKTLRLTSITIAWISTTTTANTTRIRIRVNTAGAATTSSPLVWSARVAWGAATFIANQGETVTIAIPGGLDIPAGAGVGVTHLEAAANGTIDVSLVGFEF